MPFLKVIRDTYSKRRIESSKTNGLRHAIFASKTKQLFKGNYRGEWRNDKKDGKGVELDRDGWMYNGDWSNSERTGYGELNKISEDGIIRQHYIGEWVAGKKQGFGCHWYPDGSYYEGDFCQSKRHGYGCMWYCDGAYYQGTWENNLYHANGNRYEGEFVEGNREGHGVFYHIITGQKQRGLWKEDYCINGTISDMSWRQSAPCPTPYPIPSVEVLEEIDDSEVAKESITSDEATEMVNDEPTCKRKPKRIIPNICVPINTCPCLDSIE